MQRDNYNSERENQISRRGFLGDLVKGGIALAAGLPVVRTAYAIGDANHDLVFQKRLERDLSYDAAYVQTQNEANRLEQIETDKLIENEKTRQEAEYRKANQQRRLELEHPGNFSFEKASDHLVLAKTIFCEGREAWSLSDYLQYVGTTPIVRKVLSGKSIKDIVHASSRGIFEYSFFNKSDPNKPYFDNPLFDMRDHPNDFLAWSACYASAGNLLGIKPEDINPKVTHFYVDTVPKPDWAKGADPVVTSKFNGKTTRFYYLPHMVA